MLPTFMLFLTFGNVNAGSLGDFDCPGPGCPANDKNKSINREDGIIEDLHKRRIRGFRLPSKKDDCYTCDPNQEMIEDAIREADKDVKDTQ